MYRSMIKFFLQTVIKTFGYTFIVGAVFYYFETENMLIAFLLLFVGDVIVESSVLASSPFIQLVRLKNEQ